MAALINQVNQIISAYNPGSSTLPQTGTTTSTTGTTGTTVKATSTPPAALYGQCGKQYPKLVRTLLMSGKVVQDGLVRQLVRVALARPTAHFTPSACNRLWRT